MEVGAPLLMSGVSGHQSASVGIYMDGGSVREGCREWSCGDQLMWDYNAVGDILSIMR